MVPHKRHTAPEVHFTNVSQFFKSFECSFAIVDNKSILTLDACLCFNPVSGQFCRWTGQNLNSLLDLKQFLIPPHPLDVLYLSDMKRLVTLTAGASTMTSPIAESPPQWQHQQRRRPRPLPRPAPWAAVLPAWRRKKTFTWPCRPKRALNALTGPFSLEPSSTTKDWRHIMYN